MSTAAARVKDAATSYLVGHLAGAEGGVKLVWRIADSDPGTALGGFASALAREIEEDKTTLADIIDRLGFSSQGFQELLARVMETAAQRVLEIQAGDDERVVSLVQLETLSLGIEGKRCLWKALAAATAGDARLEGIDFDHLIERAETQREGVEQHRLEAAQAALV